MSSIQATPEFIMRKLNKLIKKYEGGLYVQCRYKIKEMELRKKGIIFMGWAFKIEKKKWWAVEQEALKFQQNLYISSLQSIPHSQIKTVDLIGQYLAAIMIKGLLAHFTPLVSFCTP